MKLFCWFRFHRHDWGMPFKRKPDDVTTWKQCLECGFTKIDSVDAE